MESEPADPRIMDGTAWKEFCETLQQASKRVLGPEVPDTPRHRAEGFRYLSRFLAAGIVSCISHNDPDYPVFARMIDYTMPWGLDNPDCLYLYAPLRGAAEYRIFGKRGSANHIDFQVNFGHYANGDLTSWGTVASLDGLDLEQAEDGSFELHVGSNERKGNWLPSRDDVEFLLVRQYFDVWEDEQPADLCIERVDAVYPQPSPRSDQIAARLEKLCCWIERGGALWERMSQGFQSMEPNSLVIHMPEDAGERSGMRGQAYGIGHFRCRPDEAVILDFDVPVCRHWGVALANHYWEAVEYASRQSSLNRSQAQLSKGGHFCGVIAHEDPGVANWLDPGGNEEGTLSARFLHADIPPQPSFRVVALDDLDAALASDVPRVDPAKRGKILQARRRAVIRRFRT